MGTKEKSSVFIAIFTLNERDGWCAPAILQFLVGATSADRKLCLQVRDNVRHVDYARNCVAKDFLASSFEWLLMIDNDMAPPPELLDMVDRAEERMSILVPKFYLFAPCLKERAKNPRLPLVFAWQPLRSRPDSQEWTELAWSGAGIMFVHRRVFEGMGNGAWFRFVYDDDGQQTNSEDVNFCQKARKAGFTVWGNRAFEADHFKTISLSALARSIEVIIPPPLSELLARGIQVTGENELPSRLPSGAPQAA